MKIAQVAPLYESVPPHRYGGTERVVAYLAEELVRQIEDVTLFASGDSKTAGHLIPICPRSLRLGQGGRHTCSSYSPAGGGFSARRPIRHRSFPYRLPSLPAVASRCVSTSNHIARPA